MKEYESAEQEALFSFYRAISAYLTSYLNVPNHFWEQNAVGVLKKSSIKICAKYLVEEGIFKNANDMREDFLSLYQGIMPMWIFED